MSLSDTQIQKAYIAFFNRPADPDGFDYFQHYSATYADLLHDFSQSEEYTSDYAGKSNTQIVAQVYQNLFGRAPENEGLNYWTTQMKAGWITPANVAYEILGGARGTDKETIDNKVTAASAFTSALETTAEIDAYQSGHPAVGPKVRAWLAAIGADSKSLNSALSGMEHLVANLVDTVQGNPETPSSPTLSQEAGDGLLYLHTEGGVSARWNFPEVIGGTSFETGIGSPVNLTYSFLTALPAYYASNEELQVSAFSEAQKTATRAVLASIAEVTGLTFTEVTDSGMLTFANSWRNDGSGGHAAEPYYSWTMRNGVFESVTAYGRGGDVWVNSAMNWDTDWLDAWTPGAGGDGYTTLLHEVGHALGLSHPHDHPATNGYLLSDEAPELDNEAYTVMSYNLVENARVLSIEGTQAKYSGYTCYLRSSTLMPLDIEALQYLYGANTTTRSGDTEYSWDAKTPFLETIWDAGGIDTLNGANQIFSCIFNLDASESSAYCSIGLRKTTAEIRAGLDIPDWYSRPLPDDLYTGENNLAIAKGVTLENAIGGAGDDVFYGNAASNRFTGNGGSDTFHILRGGGNDTILDFSGVRDVIAFGSDIKQKDIQVRKSNGDLILNVKDGNAQVTLVDFFTAQDVVEALEFTNARAVGNLADIVGSVGASFVDLATLL
jgi:serralysin